jgi:hypothetical protein
MKLFTEKSNSQNFTNLLDTALDIIGSYEYDVTFHCYWNGTLNEKHLISIKSCYHFNVLNKSNRRIILWLENNMENSYNSEISQYAEIRQFYIEDEKKDTFLEGISFPYNKALSFYSDVVRYILLYKYAGCWFDLDVFFLRDFTPLFGRFRDEICVYEWEYQNYPNGALFISLLKESPTLRDAMEFIIKRNQGWGFQEAKLTYDKSLNFLVLPCNWFDAAWVINPSNFSFNDFFSNTDCQYTFENFFKGAFCFHWHNNWHKIIEKNSPCNQLLGNFE